MCINTLSLSLKVLTDSTIVRLSPGRCPQIGGVMEPNEQLRDDPLKGFALLRSVGREPGLMTRLKGKRAFDVRHRALEQLADLIGLVGMELKDQPRDML